MAKKTVAKARLMAAHERLVDPCALATPQQLKPLIQAGLNQFFPIVYSKPGQKVTVSNPNLPVAACDDPLRIEVRAAVQYRKSRGVPQFTASGQVRFGAPVTLRVFYTGASGGPITSANFQSAELFLTDITILALNIHRVPNWLDNTFLRGLLNNALTGAEEKINVTQLVALYLQGGGTIP